jgi:hypothetical protein
VHWTHVPDAVSQSGVAPEHAVAFVAEHWPHTPLGWQAGSAPPHEASVVQPTQVCVARLHIGVAAPQSPFVRQATQTPLVISHRGVAPVQAARFVAEHCVQAPVEKQAGVAPPHSASPAQARHAC